MINGRRRLVSNKRTCRGFKFLEYVSIDDMVLTMEFCKVDAIIEDHKNYKADDRSDEEDSVSEVDKIPSQIEALAAISTLQSYLSAYPNNSGMIHKISSIENFILSTGSSCTRKSNITKFF